MIVTQRAGTATPRNRTVDVARGVGITLMVFGHVVDGLALQDALDPGFVH
jgi:fucose 4-O-acetylase-like acetyltransferase